MCKKRESVTHTLKHREEEIHQLSGPVHVFGSAACGNLAIEHFEVTHESRPGQAQDSPNPSIAASLDGFPKQESQALTLGQVLLRRNLLSSVW